MNTFITSDPKMHNFAYNLVAHVRSYYRSKSKHESPCVSFRGKQKADMYVDIK